MPRGENPNSRANLKTFNDLPEKDRREMQKKASQKGVEKRTAVKKAREAAKKSLMTKDPFTPELIYKIKEDLASAASEGDREAQKMILKIFGADISDVAQKKAKADLEKTKAETQKIKAETKILELKIANPEEAEDDGFFDAIEGRLPDVWDDQEGAPNE